MVATFLIGPCMATCVAIGSCVLPTIPDDIRLSDGHFDQQGQDPSDCCHWSIYDPSTSGDVSDKREC